MHAHDPDNALAAVTHGSPYDYYRRLAAGPALLFDAALGCWLASGPGVAAVLNHRDCRVRPLAQPVPPALVDSASGAIFAGLVRMNDGARHATQKKILQQALAQVDLIRLHDAVAQLAHRHLPDDAGSLNTLMFDVPLLAVAELIGFAPESAHTVVRATRAFVAGLAANASPADLQQGALGAEALQAQLAALLQHEPAAGSLLAALRQFDGTGELAPANILGLLSQTCEATAGLLGNAVLALIKAGRMEAVPTAGWAAMVAEVAKHDPAIHNTRRYAACALDLEGAAIAEGQMILVLLASAGMPYGHGVHLCPGQALAHTIVAATLEQWQPALCRLALEWRYRPSPNARIPVFSDAGAP